MQSPGDVPYVCLTVYFSRNNLIKTNNILCYLRPLAFTILVAHCATDCWGNGPRFEFAELVCKRGNSRGRGATSGNMTHKKKHVLWTELGTRDKLLRQFDHVFKGNTLLFDAKSRQYNKLWQLLFYTKCWQYSRCCVVVAATNITAACPALIICICNIYLWNTEHSAGVDGFQLIGTTSIFNCNFKKISIIYYCRFMFLVSLIFCIGEKFQNNFPLSRVQDPSSYLKLMTGISWMLQVSPSSRPARILAKNPRISGL